MLKRKLPLIFGVLLTLVGFAASAQNGQPCYKPLAGFGTYPARVNNGFISLLPYSSGIYNLTDADRNNKVNLGSLANLLAGNGVTVIDTAHTYPAGYYAGYVFDLGANPLSISLLNAVTVSIYNNGVLQQSVAGGNLLVSPLISGATGKTYLYFKTTQAFDEVRFTYSSLGSVLSATNVYYAMAFDPDCGSLENNGICNDAIAGQGTSVSYNGGLLCALCSLTNTGRITDGDKENYALLTLPGSVLTDVSAGVLDEQHIYPAGYKAGFVVSPDNAATLFNANILNSFTVETYLFGQLQESKNFVNGTGLFNLNLLSSSAISKQKIGFVTTKNFNEVRLHVNQPLSVNIGSIRVYYAFEEPSSCNDCRQELTTAAPAPYTGSVVGNTFLGPVWTGTYGLALQALVNPGNVVSPAVNSYATYTTPFIAGLSAGGRVTVQTSGTMPANAFAGFAFSKQNGLVDAAFINAVTVRTYMNGTLVGSSTGASLVTGSMLGGTSGLTTVGFKSPGAFNRIQIDVYAGLLNFGLFDSYNLYKAFVILDSDNDGIADCSDLCTGGNDNLDGDGDGIPDACDACSVTTSVKSTTFDTDGDGLADACDADSDNDGLADVSEDMNGDGDPTNDDYDGDGIANYLDLDSDNDGIPDLYESGVAVTVLAGLDSDRNGVIDASVAKGQNGMANVLESGDIATAVSNFTLKNTDGDTKADYLDLDSDNDGINDIAESGLVSLDVNNDGMADGTDTDMDGVMSSADAAPATFGAPVVKTVADTDLDGIYDFRDLDSDNDGFNDIRESGLALSVDANNDGMADGADTDGDGIRDVVDGALLTRGDAASPEVKDTDGDGVPNYLDLDSDNDSINDLRESGATLLADSNGDGMVDSIGGLNDADGDGILATADGNPLGWGDNADPMAADSDGDGSADYLDLDSDNDGVNDVKESGLTALADANGDGMVDGADADGDGIVGIADGSVVRGDANDAGAKDTDGDGVSDMRDLDSDNDGINDIKESGLPAGIDANGDGMADGTDTDGDGIRSTVDGSTSWGDTSDPAVKDTDGDGVPDVRDLDTDNDGINDVIENGLATADINSDGMVDGADTDGDGIVGVADNNTAWGDTADPVAADTDSDGVPDYRDLDSDNDGRGDLQESGISGLTDVNNNGVADGPDTDGDGIQDNADGNVNSYGDGGTNNTPRDTDADGTPDYTDTDSNNDGISDISDSGLAGLDNNSDGMIDNPVDTDGDGISENTSNNTTPDTDPIHFGGIPLRVADLTPAIVLENASFHAGDSYNAVVTISEINNVGALGTVTIMIPKPSTVTGYMITVPSGVTSISMNGASQEIDNDDWNISQTSASWILTLKSGIYIHALGSSRIGFTLTRTTAGMTSSGGTAIPVRIPLGSGGDASPVNNIATVIVISL